MKSDNSNSYTHTHTHTHPYFLALICIKKKQVTFRFIFIQQYLLSTVWSNKHNIWPYRDYKFVGGKRENKSQEIIGSLVSDIDTKDIIRWRV